MHNSGLHLFSADLVTTHGDWSCTCRPSWENNEFCDELRSLRRRQRSRKLWPRLPGGTRRRLMQRILSLFVLHNPPRELEQEAGIEVSCRWFRSSGRCTTNNTFVRFGTLLDWTYHEFRLTQIKVKGNSICHDWQWICPPCKCPSRFPRSTQQLQRDRPWLKPSRKIEESGKCISIQKLWKSSCLHLVVMSEEQEK